VSDAIKLLDEIPIWKAVAGLPKRVAELERKLAALESAASDIAAKPTGKECPICGATMKVVKETPHPDFAFAGMKVHRMRCGECGEETNRDFEPGKGYR
jgi:transposase